jgi:hypothetical protein
MAKLPLPPTHTATYQKNTKEQYEMLGRFVEAFELMVHEVREICIEQICQGIGSSERERLIEIAFHNQSMTAKPLFDIMRAIIAEIVNIETNQHHKERETFRKVLSCIEVEYNHLYNKRNELLHGTWFVGYVSDDDPDSKEFRVQKFKTTSDGLASAKLPKNADELLTLVNRCNDARTWVGAVGFCLQETISICDHFSRPPGEPWRFYLTPGSVGTTLPRK